MRKNEKVFSLATKICLRQEYFGGLLFAPITGEVIQLNRVAFELLRQILKHDSLRVVSRDLAFWENLQTRGIVREVIPND